jgi:hypothetical protein
MAKLETSAVLAEELFVIRVSSFFRHSAFGFRHFALLS